MRRENLTFLAGLRDDAYSRALLDEVSDLAEAAKKALETRILEMPVNNVYYLHGYIKGLLEVLEITDNANAELAAMPD